jgi:nucleotide-binding universal stress UspA family protein
VGIAAGMAPGYLLRWAAEQALHRDTSLRLVQACDLPAAGPAPPLGANPRGTEIAAQRHLGKLIGWLSERYPGLAVTGVVHYGTPAGVLAEQVPGAALVVIGRHERGRVVEALFGSTAAHVAGAAGRPVVAVPDRIGPVPADGPVVIGVKGDPGPAAAALRFAAAAADLGGVPLHVIHYRAPGAGEDPGYRSELAGAVAALRSAFPAVPAHVFLLDGDAAQLLAWESGRASLLVLAADRGWWHRRLGPVARAVLRRAACPVALVPGAPVRVPVAAGRGRDAEEA